MDTTDTRATRFLSDTDPSVPVPARMAHVVYYTAQYETMKRWYQTVFNATMVRERYGTQAFFTFDNEHHRILVSHQPQVTERPRDSAGVAHIAWTYSDLKSLFATYDRLKAEGIVPEWTVNHGMTTSLYYRDPDWNRIELQVENYDDVVQAFENIQAVDFGNADFDADKMSALVRQGVPEETLKSQKEVVALIGRGEL